jgi:hypothetical protein
MDHHPSGGAGGSGRRPVAAGPDQRPDQEALFAPEEVLPLATSTGVTVAPAVPGPAPALDLDAVSDYVPDPDDALALDYGPVPDTEAARDYGLGLDYDARTESLSASEPASAPAPAQISRAAVGPGPAAEPAPVLHLAPRPAVTPLAPAQAPDPVPGPDPAATFDPAQHPGPVTSATPAPTLEIPAPAPETPAPGPAAPAHAPAPEDPWALDPGPAQVSPGTYWRRRLVALVAGIALLTLLVWAVSGVLQGTGPGTRQGGKPSTGPGAAHGRQGVTRGHKGGSRSGHRNAGHTGHAARRNAPKALPVPATGRAATISATAGHSASGALAGVSDVLTMAGARQRRGSAASRTPHRPQPRAPVHRAMARATGPQVPACGRGDVVLSLVSPRYWYERGRWPLFGVDAVSTAARPCRFNMGSRFATVVVTSGRTRIWGSADCARGTGSQSVVLNRGVPAVRWIYWDRATSAPGCRPPHLPVRQDPYTAIAFDGQLSSQALVFILGRPGSSLP